MLISSFFALVLCSCHYTSGSGNIVTEKRTVDHFDALSVSSSFDVEVTMGPVTEVRVEADDNIIKYVETSVSGNTLKIKTEGLHNINNAHLKVYITTPTLVDITASASADIKLMNLLQADSKIKFNASSAGSIEAEVDAPGVEAGASSSGTVILTGKTKNYTAEASSSGDLKTIGLLSENTDVSVSSGGNAAVYASINLEAHASSGGDITYDGAGNVKQTTSSGGSIQKK